MTTPENSSTPLDAVLAEYLQAIDRGQAPDRAELLARHPHLAGGLSAYPANSAHGPFVHIDARGARARW